MYKYIPIKDAITITTSNALNITWPSPLDFLLGGILVGWLIVVF
jgi:hypothetical protein